MRGFKGILLEFRHEIKEVFEMTVLSLDLMLPTVKTFFFWDVDLRNEIGKCKL